MKDQDKEQYVHTYEGSAIALGGRITRPFEQIIESQASSVLPIDGGLGSARVENFNFRQIVSFKNAYSLVTGSQSERDGSFSTLATVTIEGLNILDVVTAERIVCRVSSHYSVPPIKPGTTLTPSPEPQVVAIGSKFENLNIGGCELEVELNSDFVCEWNTYTELKAKSRMTEYKGRIACSLIKEINKKSPCSGVNISGNKIEIPHFGSLELAQYFCAPEGRRLVMLRAHLGCPVSGTVDTGGGQGSGSTAP